MAHWRSAGLPLACVLVVVSAATAQESAGEKRYELNLEDALALARERAPAIRAARARIGLARGHLEDASALLPRNPSLEVGGGPRLGPDGTSVDLEAGVGFAFELGGQREARIEAATGAIEQAQATALDTRRRLLRATAVAFLRTRHAAERLRVADEVAALADEIHRVAKRRHEAGDVGVLDVKLAALALARARSEVETLRTARDRLTAGLRILLGLEPEALVTVRGELLDRRRHDLAQLLSRAAERPDLRAMDAAIRSADAEVRLGQRRAWPDLGLKLGYAREEDANLVVGALEIDLPFIDYGEGQAVSARARGGALRIERRFAEAKVLIQVRSLFAAHQRLLGAVEQFETEALSQLEQTEHLVRRSYEAGALPLFELLAMRRELIASRTAHLDLLLQAALTGVELEAETGVLQ